MCDTGMARLTGVDQLLLCDLPALVGMNLGLDGANLSELSAVVPE